MSNFSDLTLLTTQPPPVTAPGLTPVVVPAQAYPLPQQAYPSPAVWNTQDRFNGASDAERTALGEYLANNGNVHVIGAPLSEQEQTAQLARLFARPSDGVAASGATLFAPTQPSGAIPVFDRGMSADPSISAYLADAARDAYGQPAVPNGDVPADQLPAAYRAVADGQGDRASDSAAKAPAESDETADETKASVKNAKFEYRSDGSLEGKANDADAKGSVEADPKNLLNANRDIPGGFQVGGVVSGDNVTGYKIKVDGHDVVIDQNGEGPMRVTVDGREVKKGDVCGPVDFQNDGPGGCGTVKIKGQDDKTGAKIETSFTKDIREEQKSGAGVEVLKALLPIGGDLIASRMKDYKHVGVSMHVDSATGPNGDPMSLGGKIGEALTK